MARTYYHVAGTAYRLGEPLLCWDRLVELGVEQPWKWGEAEEGFDGDVVCLFATRAEAEAFAGEYGGTILRVTIPDEPDDRYPLPWGGSIAPRLTTVAEGFTAVRDGIPAEWLRVVE